MLRRSVLIGVGVLSIVAALAVFFYGERAPEPPVAMGPYDGTLRLNGVPTRVRWTDGDSFRILDGSHHDTNVRLRGFNALEAYGPVHRWGDWSATELYAIASQTKRLGAAEIWDCTSELERDSYGRLLVSCPGVGRELVRQGQAHVFAIDGDPDPEMLALQDRAQQDRVGMWRKGVPSSIITSVHSAEEGRGYNRFADTTTGRSGVVQHDDTYDTCQEVCGGEDGRQSCLVYVPYARRYTNQPSCLR